MKLSYSKLFCTKISKKKFKLVKIKVINNKYKSSEIICY